MTRKPHLSDLVYGELTASQIIEMNKYHDDPSKEGKYQNVRDACVNLMLVINENCPVCYDRTRALNAVRDVRMLANSAIALDGL